MSSNSSAWATLRCRSAISADLGVTAEVTPVVPVAPVARVIDDAVLAAPMEGATQEGGLAATAEAPW